MQSWLLLKTTKNQFGSFLGSIQFCPNGGSHSFRVLIQKLHHGELLRESREVLHGLLQHPLYPRWMCPHRIWCLVPDCIQGDFFFNEKLLIWKFSYRTSWTSWARAMWTLQSSWWSSVVWSSWWPSWAAVAPGRRASAWSTPTLSSSLLSSSLRYY